MPKGNISESVQVLREAVAAFAAWRDRLDEPEGEAELERWVARCERVLAAKDPSRSGTRYAFHWPSRGRSGGASTLTCSFDVLYVVGVHGRRSLVLLWTLDRTDGKAEPLRIEGTWLSLADELAESFADRLETDPATGTLRLRSSGMPFSMLVHGIPRAAREMVADFIQPLIIVGPTTSEEEVVAQLAIFALRSSDLLDDPSAVFALIEGWLGRLVRVSDSHLITDAAVLVLKKWLRPMSSRSFRDYCRRTVRGLVKDTARRHADQRGAPADGEVRTVDDLARSIKAPRRTLYRWLRDGRIKGPVSTWTSTASTASGLTVRRRHRRYEVDAATNGAAVGMLRERTLRRDLVTRVAARRGTTVRAARAIVRRRIDDGATLEDVARELLAVRRPQHP